MPPPLLGSRPFNSALWRHGDFLRLWSAQTLSQFAGQIGALAIPLVAIAVLEVSPFQVGPLATAATLPFLLAFLPLPLSPLRSVRTLADAEAAVGLGSREQPAPVWC